MTPFQQGMVFVAKWEWSNRADGGYTNDPTDPGGETKYGISKRAHPDVDVKNLSLADAFTVYKRDYWDANQLDSVKVPLCVAMLDACIQHGASRMEDFKDASNGDWKAFNDARRDFYYALIAKKPAMIKYKNGWLNRLNDLNKYCAILEQTPS